MKNTNDHILIADIGGTNTNFGLMQASFDFAQDERVCELIAYYQVPSQSISDFTATFREIAQKIIQEQHVSFTKAVLGVAGPVTGKQERVKPTNLPFYVDSAAVKKAAGLADVLMVNDFITVVCGYEYVQNTLTIQDVTLQQQAQKAFIGAGTGLGQAAAVWCHHANRYIPVASEGGHTLFVARDQFDRDFATFIESEQLVGPVTWEQVLSGKGISALYSYLGLQEHYPATAISQEIKQSHFKPDYISRYALHDEQCRQTFNVYAKYYARYAQQVALETVALGGLYIAGGIAAKNKYLFTNHDFLKYFTDHPYQRKLLEKVPIFLIQDYQVNLYGGAHYYFLQHNGMI